jgi:hypothetical protein
MGKPQLQEDYFRDVAALAQRVESLERALVAAQTAIAFRARRSANISLGAGTPQYIDYDVVDFNIGSPPGYGYGANSGFGSRRGFTCPVAGVYRFSWGITTQPIAVYGEPILRQNAVDQSYAGTREAHNVTGGSWHFGTDMFKAAVGDFFEMVLQWDNSGGSVLLLSNRAYTFFNGELVGRIE